MCDCENTPSGPATEKSAVRGKSLWAAGRQMQDCVFYWGKKKEALNSAYPCNKFFFSYLLVVVIKKTGLNADFRNKAHISMSSRCSVYSGVVPAVIFCV